MSKWEEYLIFLALAATMSIIFGYAVGTQYKSIRR